jgi:hypothetical protein
MSDGAGTVEKFKIGDRVKINKTGTQNGKTGVVVDPDWTGRLKLQMDEDGKIKSYLHEEVEVHHLMEKIMPKTSIEATGKTRNRHYAKILVSNPLTHVFVCRGWRRYYSGSVDWDTLQIQPQDT